MRAIEVKAGNGWVTLDGGATMSEARDTWPEARYVGGVLESGYGATWVKCADQSLTLEEAQRNSVSYIEVRLRPYDDGPIISTTEVSAVALIGNELFSEQLDACARANRLSDECGALRTERDELLRENAVLRRKLEKLERKR